MLDLKSYTNNLPPGGFWFDQTEGIFHRFEATWDLREQAIRVSDFRKGNNLPRADVESCALDIVAYTCQRYPNWCYDTDTPVAQTIAAPKRGRCCGARVP